MSTERKLAVTLVFFTGALASGASLIRMLWMIWANHVGYDPTMDEERQYSLILTLFVSIQLMFLSSSHF
jgi:hypothetical protein